MTSAHIIFIPAVLAIGIFIGFFLGGRAAVDRMNLEKRRDADREEAKRRRQERQAAAASKNDPA